MPTEGIFHVHSRYSSDGKLSLDELKNECVSSGMLFMIVTEHAEDFDSKKMDALVADCRRVSGSEFFAIPGLEFVVDVEHDTHLLACGLTELPTNIDIAVIFASVERAGGLTVIAHPSRNGGYVPAELVDKLDGIEVWNAAYDSRYLPSAASLWLLKKLRHTSKRLLAFGGLDLHGRTGFRGLRLRLLDRCNSAGEVLVCLKSGRFTIRGRFITLSPTSQINPFWLGILSVARFGLSLADKFSWRLKRLVSRKTIPFTESPRPEQ